ncbi:hypothetical protein M8C13_00045 [Crossiella sp. SN42]|uniref:hypothetical protein n=1 Tax=Crossiella sp. SN42 TaxID=2944808 RepID=UPI00207CC6FC|nr:hypothetical protein [Crossiella sp. SN42]MCO1574147.1 hypothetical protein [Crossiella sp. SN42]
MIIVSLAVYLGLAGLERADKLASVIGALAALTALVAPYLLRARPPAQADSAAAQGVQINHGGANSQVNHFREKP